MNRFSSRLAPKLLRPKIANFGRRYPQASVAKIFLNGLQNYAGLNTPSVMTKVKQVFDNSQVDEGQFIFSPEGMNMTKQESRLQLEDTYKTATKEAITAFDQFQSRTPIDRVFMATEIPGCPPLGHLLPHPHTESIIGHGCLGAISLIKAGQDYLRHHPTHAIALYTAEIPSRCWHTQFPVELRRLIELDIKHQNGTGEVIDVYKQIIFNTIVAALMRDGSGYAVMLGCQHKSYFNEAGWLIHDNVTETYPEASSFVGTQVTEYGTRMFLSPQIPTFIAPRAGKMISNFLEKHCLALRDVSHTMIHPGGPKVLIDVNKVFDNKLNLDRSFMSLRKNGNCITKSLLDVISRHTEDAKYGDVGLIYGVGPGMRHGVHLVEYR